MHDMLDDPGEMTPSQRSREIAVILARGVLRLRQCRESSPNSQESGHNCLDEVAQKGPHGVVG